MAFEAIEADKRFAIVFVVEMLQKRGQGDGYPLDVSGWARSMPRDARQVPLTARSCELRQVSS